VPQDRLVVSVAAGTTTAFIERRLAEGTPVVRVMSNTPVLVDEAMSAISAGSHATEDHLRRTEAVFTPVGRTIRVPESQQDAVTALSGSGPAYFFYLVEAMIDAGILLGLPRAVAAELIVQTAVGSAKMLKESGEHPVVLREAVMSPAGTTIRSGIGSFAKSKPPATGRGSSAEADARPAPSRPRSSEAEIAGFPLNW